VADPADADPVTSMDFSIDGSPVGSLSSDIYVDIAIPDVTGISDAPGNVQNILTPGTSSGIFDLLIGSSPLASEYLVIELGQVNVTYVDVANVVQFSFGAAVSDVFAQNLPFALQVGDPITISFSAQLSPGTLTT